MEKQGTLVVTSFTMKLRILLFICCYFCIIMLHAANFPYYHFKQLSIKEGLPSSVTSLYDDNNGFLWIGSTQGVYRFNGTKIKKYLLPTEFQQGTHFINNIRGDHEHRVWVFTKKGIAYYEKGKDALRVLLRKNEPIKASTLFADGDRLVIPILDTLLIYDSKDLSLCESIPLKDSPTYIMGILDYDSGHYLIRTDRREMKLLHKHTGEMSNPPFSETSSVYNFYMDSSQHYWISYYAKGVRCYTQAGKLLATYDTHNSGLNNDIILHMEEWNGGIWLATDGGGVNIIYPKSREVQVLSNRKKRNFPANSVTCFYHNDNHMWIGTVREGVLGVEKGFITTYTKSPTNQPTGLSDKCPLYLWEDAEGIIWIGTDGGGINSFDPKTEQFTHYPKTSGEKIVSVCPLTNTLLLLSSFSKGLYLFNKKNGDYQYLTLPDKGVEEKFVRSDAPINLRVNQKQEIELYGSAFYRYLPKLKQIRPIPVNLKEIGASWVYIGEYQSCPVFHDRNNVFRYNTSKNEYEMVFYQKDNQILAASIDSMGGTLWIATPNGVSNISLLTGQKENIKLPGGNDVITSLVADRDGIVWMGSLGGLYAYNPSKDHFIIYSEMDGVLPNDFLPKPVLVASDGNIYMGGSEGLLRINKALQTRVANRPADLQTQEILLNGQSVIFEQHSTLSIPDNFSSLEIRVQLKGPNIFRKHIFRFRIRGLNQEYIETTQPLLTLHTLPSGSYQITAQCTLNDGSWSPEAMLLALTVLPPWWKQTWFLFLCVGVGFLVLIYFVHAHNRNLKRKLREQEREIYKDKVRTLININHELRTPLTLIYSPLKQLINSKQIPRELHGKVQSAFKQARQMKNIIDMILNMRKMEVEQNILHMSVVPFNEWLGVILDDFKEEFSVRDIVLRFLPDSGIESMYFDHSQCEIIINNLLTNAYKFSERYSTVTVSTHLEEDGEYVRVVVSDEGVGLQEEDMSHLFTRFYQGNHGIQGSGIGLSYAKQLVEMHGGTIGAGNNEDKGANFFFRLPYRQEPVSIKSTPKTYLNNILPDGMVNMNKKQEGEIPVEKFHSILIVEDDRDLCSFLICNLQPLFKEVYEAHDGMEALPIISSKMPQMVVSDIKMPRMNGFELCRYIKQKPELSYIPVILLTSCVDDETVEKGFKLGVEAYITKPFDIDLLAMQIQNILKNLKNARKHYSAWNISAQSDEELTPVDEHLVIQLNRIISENIGNADMDVNFIAGRMGMSRASLYAKTKSTVKMGINEYICKCRLEHSRQLIETTRLSIGEIAEQSGFRHSRNFSTLFKNKMGESPSDYRRRKASSG